MNDDKNETFNSSLLKIQSLESEFGIVMKQYEEAHLNYINSLNNTSTQTQKYLSIPGSTFNGTGGLVEGSATEEQCKAACSSSMFSTCTGATYNSEKAYCWLRTGPGEPQISTNTGDNALINELSQNITLIQSLNKRLSDISQEIDKEISSVLPEAKREIDLKNSTKGKLNSIYNQLKEDRIQIDAQLKEYQKINQEYVDTNIYVNQTNSKYILWSIFAIIILFYTVKSIVFPNASSNIFRIIFWTVIAILFMITTTRLNTSAGFLLWGLIITFVAFTQMKMIPTP